MVKCIRSECGHQEIRGRPYFLSVRVPGQPPQDKEHCPDCAKKIIGPQIEVNLKDTRTLINSFGEFFPGNLSEVGRVEVVEGKAKVYGRLGGAIVAFRRGDLWPAKAASSTTLAEAHYRIGKLMLEAVDRLFPHARYRDRQKVATELKYTKEQFVKCEADRQIVEEHRQRQEIIPTDNRRAFLKVARDVFIGAKKVFDVIGGSFYSEERAAHVSKEDGRLIEVVKGFNPATLQTKPEDEIGEGEKPTEPPAGEEPAAEESGGPEVGQAEPTGGLEEVPAAEATQMETGEAGEPKEPEVTVPEPPPAGKQPPKKKAAKKPKKKDWSNSGRSFKLNGVDAGDPAEIAKGLKVNSRGTRSVSRARANKEAIAAAAETEE